MRRRVKLMTGAVDHDRGALLAGPAQASTAADDQYGAVLGKQSGAAPTSQGTAPSPSPALT